MGNFRRLMRNIQTVIYAALESSRSRNPAAYIMGNSL